MKFTKRDIIIDADIHINFMWCSVSKKHKDQQHCNGKIFTYIQFKGQLRFVLEKLIIIW